jgi:hypothetical protein
MKKYDTLKVYNILKELHEEISEPKKMSLFNFLAERNSSKQIGSVLIKTGIVSKKNLTPGGRSCVFKWNSIIPNYKMVEAVIYEARKKSSKKEDTEVTKKETESDLWSTTENANSRYPWANLKEENNKSEEPNHRPLEIGEFEICDNGTKEKLKQLEEINENSIYKIGELHDIVDTYKNMLKNLNAERQHNVDKILDQNKRIQELTNYQNETLYTTKELKNEVEKWRTAYNEMQHKIERQVKIANDLHQQVAVFNKKQKDRSIKNFTILWGMIKINY